MGVLVTLLKLDIPYRLNYKNVCEGGTQQCLLVLTSQKTYENYHL